MLYPIGEGVGEEEEAELFGIGIGVMKHRARIQSECPSREVAFEN